MHINPDHFLQTAKGRVVTPERNRDAWAQSYNALEAALRREPTPEAVYLLVGAQGSGKSTWVKAQVAARKHGVFFDAILVQRTERAAVLARVKPFRIPAVAVWMQTPLEVCLARNARRAADEFVPEQAIRNVFAAVQPPSLQEGFSHVIEVPHVEAGG
jgi:predicted kinase